MPAHSPLLTPGRAMAPRMTGIGCYGRPGHIARTLDRALTRFGLKSSDMLTVAWQPEPQEAGGDRSVNRRQRHMPGGKAVVLLSQPGQVKGFFLLAAEAGPQLHVHVHGSGRRP